MIKKCLIVLGMHRSGTSVTTGLLYLLGTHPGTSLLPPNPRNPKGFFESRKIVSFNNKLFSSLGCSWDSLYLLPENWVKLPVIQDLKAELIETFYSEFDTGKLPVIKDPRMCCLLPIWLEVFQEIGVKPYFVVVTRNPDAVVDSMRQMKGFSRLKCLVLYMNYLAFIGQSIQNHPHSFVNYPQLLGEWHAIVPRIEKQLGIKFTNNVNDIKSQVSSFISKELNHSHIYNIEGEYYDVIEDLAHDLYQQLSSKNGPDFAVLESLCENYINYHKNAKSLFSKINDLEKELVYPDKNANRYYRLNTKSVLYWSETADQCIKKASHVFSSYQFDDQPQYIRFIIPEGVTRITSLRLDVMDRAGSYKLQSMRIVCNDGMEKWRWDGGEQVFGRKAGNRQFLVYCNSHNEAYFITEGNDPYFIFDLPKEFFNKIKPGWALEITVFIKMVKDVPSDMNKYIQELKNNIDRANRQIDKRDITVKSLKNSLIKLKGEISRIERLFDFLKDLFYLKP